MAPVVQNNVDYLAARFHGRRGELAEAERLDELCRLRTIPELTRAVFPDARFQTSAEFQRGALEALVAELGECPGHLDGPGSDLLDWMQVRFQVENLKVLLRAFLEQIRFEVAQAHLVSLPAKLALDTRALLAADSLEQFCDRLPRDVLGRAMKSALDKYRVHPRPFLLECALDRGYYEELLARARFVSRVEREVIEPLCAQETNTFQMMLAVRGRLLYGLAPEWLLPFHLPAPGIPLGRFRALLAAPDGPSMAVLVRRRVIDGLPAEAASGGGSAAGYAAEMEALAWSRYLHLANRAFRHSHMGLGAIVGFAGIRRVEAANLVTLAEGIRVGLAPEVVRARLIPRYHQEADHV